MSPASSIYRTHTLVEFAKENIRYRFPGWGIGPDASLRQAKACRLKGMGRQEVPEHEAPLRAGKGKRTKMGTLIWSKMLPLVRNGLMAKVVESAVLAIKEI